MTRTLCFTLLFLIALPLFAQNEPPEAVGRALPRDWAFLMRMREQVALQLQQIQQDLQQIQQTLAVVPHNDTHIIEILTTKQAELTAKQAELIKQHNDVLKELQTVGNGAQSFGSILPGTEGRTGMVQAEQFPTQPMPPAMPLGQRGSIQVSPMPVMPTPQYPLNPLQGMPTYGPVNNGQGTMMPGMPMPNDAMVGVPAWGNPQATWDAPYWGPRLPKELTDVKQSVVSLQRDIASLKELVEKLESQIQLLNRAVALERMNEQRVLEQRMFDRVRESEE